ncbi:MAG TPA: aminotransferase class I/II-fold pyridoxal phosphate-dependent enzyme [Gemmatimonadales bacterium]|nr:aminotransferase class I/II-fold pyridoxal phosphate-dependent enzyme [Gemmatimonadales bacterium]
MTGSGELSLLKQALEQLQAGFSDLPEAERGLERKAITDVLTDVAKRLHDNYPYFHPLYAGQMLKPPHPIARIAYELALQINPNNHALDGGRASSAMEKEAVAELAKMIGWDTHLGHLCSGGTMANLEALWVAGQLHPGKTVLASTQAHYTHARLAGVLGLAFETVECDRRGRMDVLALERRLAAGGIGTVVATMGTTATGAVDPLAAIVDLRRRYDFRIHADAAYGGYFLLTDSLEDQTMLAFACLREAASVVIDPHKHGLQPYGCGSVLFRDPSVGRLYRHDSPYTYYTSDDLHLGEITLECSRPGAAAVALWATQQLLPLERGGAFARGLADGRAAALDLYARLAGDRRFVTGPAPELDILVWAPRAPRVSDASALARRVFDEAARRNLHLALVSLPLHLIDVQEMQHDRETMICLRSVLMKPEHRAWTDRIWTILDQAATAAGLSR